MSKSKKFSGNHQRSWLWGFHAVTETLKSGRWPVLEIYVVQESLEHIAGKLELHQDHSIPVHVVLPERIEQLTGNADHQGMAIRLGQFPYVSMDEMESSLRQSLQSVRSSSDTNHSSVPLVVICDRIQDAFNLGAILRCCDGTNVSMLIVGEKHQSEVTPHVARSSAGAVNYIPIARSSDLMAAAKLVKSLGMQLVAADSNGSHSVWDAPLTAPTALIIGSEAYGISQSLLDLCDLKVTIPMYGHVTSLNAAVAAGILLYEIRRQHKVPSTYC
ncbi:MAG: RNA methyltransferase [Pirellulales bacterium]